MADLRMKRTEDSQPLGWTERRMQLRLIDDKIWRRVIMSYDQSVVDAKRLEVLKDLKIDMLNKEELHDYLIWISEEEVLDIGDVYRMYLGYSMEESFAQEI